MSKTKLFVILGLIGVAFLISIGPVFGADGLSLLLTADKDTAEVGENITYTYTVKSDNVSVSDLILTDSRFGNIPLSSTNLTAGENITATFTYTVVVGDLPGPIVNSANVTGQGSTGNTISASSNNVSVEVGLPDIMKTKAQLLMERGVPGKGIENAPGLQKPFNPNSQAYLHAGGGNDEEQLDDQSQLTANSEKPEHPGKKK